MDVTRAVPRAGFVVAIAMVAALATASAATAQSTVGKDVAGTGIVYTDPGSNTDRIALDWLDNTSTDTFEHAIVSVAGTAPVSAGTGCDGGPATFFCGATMLSLTAALGGGDDALDLRNASDKGHALPAAITGGSGADTVLGGTAAEDFGGGTGDDRFIGALSPGDAFRGQDGTDTLDLSNESSGFTITLDGVPDDGPGSGGSANVGLDVERVFGGSGTDDITGGIGAETLHGGAGADIIEGGAGADQLVGAEGGDTLLARDDFVDGVTCGAGDDTVFADWNDVVAADCETVTRAPRDDDGDGSPRGVDCDDTNAAVEARRRRRAGQRARRGLRRRRRDRRRGRRRRRRGRGLRRRGPRPVPRRGRGAGERRRRELRRPRRRVPVRRRDGRLRLEGLRALHEAHVAQGQGRARGREGPRDLQGRQKKGCPFKRKSATAGAKGAVSLTRRFKGARLKPGAVVEVRVSAPAAVAKVLRIRIRARKAPKRTTLCLRPGARKPGGCG